MPGRIAELRDAVADFLAAGTFPYSFEVYPVNYGVVQIKATNFTQVYVYPDPENGRQQPDYTRDNPSRLYMIKVHLLNYLDTDNPQQEIDQALHLNELFEDALWDQEQAGWQFVNFQHRAASIPFFFLDSAYERNRVHTQLGCVYGDIA